MASATELRARAERLVIERKPLLAIKELNKAIVLDPKNANLYFVLGMANRQLGRRKRTAEAFEKLLQLDPKHPQATKVRRYVDKYRRSV